jgi:hypothetical protein
MAIELGERSDDLNPIIRAETVVINAQNVTIGKPKEEVSPRLIWRYRVNAILFAVLVGLGGW